MRVIDLRDSFSDLLLDKQLPKDIANNPWIAYHGTSSTVESIIDQSGLAWQPNTYTREDVDHIVAIYDELDWLGLDGAGYQVLMPFSQGHDFDGRDKKAIYLANSAERALLFASQDFAGGETARAIRHALDDLSQYLHNPELRKIHREYRWRAMCKYINMACRNAQHPRSLVDLNRADVTDSDLLNTWQYLRSIHPSPDVKPPWNSDLELLQNRLNDMKELHDRCNEFRDKHKHGVIYAINNDKDLLSRLEVSNCMGLLSHELIGRSRIAAKILLPIDMDPDTRDMQRGDLTMHKLDRGFDEGIWAFGL